MKEDHELVELPVSGVEDEHGALIVEKALGKIRGVTHGKMEFNNHKAIIEATDKDAVNKAIHAIRDIGYKVDILKKEFPVSGMSCASCAVNVQNKLNQEPGVLDASVNYANGKAVVEYIPGVGFPLHFKRSVQSIGYDLMVSGQEGDEDVWEKNQASAFRKVSRRTFLSIALAIPVVVIAMGFPGWKWGEYLVWMLATVVVFSFGRQFFINAFKLARHGSANMDTLVALSAGIAYLFSVFNILFPEFWLQRGLEGHLYFEAATVVVTFILLGKMLEEKAKANISFAIKKLMGLQPSQVVVMGAGDQEKIKNIAEVAVGDHILVRPGDKIAVDGKVLSGNSYVDESTISGEPLAVFKEKESPVFGGTINQKGSFVFEATKVGSETLLAHIIKMVQQAQGSKAPVQKLVDKIAGIFVPSVMGIAVAVFGIWLAFGGAQAFSHGLLAMITVLVIACPCALGLATPTAIMAGMGKGAQNGILIKDASSLELARKITSIVLDKTGTITQGSPRLVHWLWDSPSAEEQYGAVLLSAEAKSEHPLAASVVEKLSEGSLQKVPLDQFESLPGLGIRVARGNEIFYVGSQELMREHQVTFAESLTLAAQKWQQEASTVIWFASEQRALAVLAFSDTIKANSAEAIRTLQKMNIKVHMLTGDNEKTASVIAEATGIRSYKAGLKPDQKAAFIKELQSHGEIVAMAGDGINDSAALAQADVSIAMGHGSDIAMDTATITLISSDLVQIPKAVRLSSVTGRLIKENLFWAFIYNLIAIPLAAGVLYPSTGFLLNPMIGGAAMAMSSVSVVSNSLRLKWIKL